jgi:neutrophil factor 2
LLAAGNDPIDPPIVRGATGLGRSKTTLNVPIDARERIAGLQSGGQPRSPEGSAPPRSAGVGRASSTRDRSPGAGMAGPVRGLSVRKVSATEERRPPVPNKGEFFFFL